MMEPILLFLNLGGSEILLILLVILLLFGSKKIPELARGLGKGLREFKDATQSIQREIEKGVEEAKKDTDPEESKKPSPEAKDIKPQKPEDTIARRDDDEPFDTDESSPNEETQPNKSGEPDKA